MLKKTIILLALAFALTACGSVKTIGKVGKYDIYNVSEVGIFAPSVSALMAYDEDREHLVPLGASNSGSVAGQLLSAGAIVGGAAIIGSAMSGIDTSTEATVNLRP